GSTVRGWLKKYGLQDGGKPATPLPSGFTVEPCADEEIVKTHQQQQIFSLSVWRRRIIGRA
ncbi:hypothetical protein CLOP_g22065, partial [Closterium sp. NIES-67]